MFGICPLTNNPISTEQVFAWMCRIFYDSLLPNLSLTCPHNSHFLSMYLLYHTHPKKSIGKSAQIAGRKMLKICTIFYLTKMLKYGIMENWLARGPPIITHLPPFVNTFLKKILHKKIGHFPPYLCTFYLLTLS